VSALDPLSDEQREIRELVRTIARERIAPRAAEIDKSAKFPWDVVELFRENDLFGIMVDEEYGGIGASALMTLVTIEELSKVCATSGLIVAGHQARRNRRAEAAIPAEARKRRVARRVRTDRARQRL
jgi:alkylation response protein AidB-like acyl-CoA dehydrogenase